MTGAEVVAVVLKTYSSGCAGCAAKGYNNGSVSPAKLAVVSNCVTPFVETFPKRNCTVRPELLACTGRVPFVTVFCTAMVELSVKPPAPGVGSVTSLDV